MKTIDVRGLTCPQPLIRVRQDLDAFASGEEFEILLDDQTSTENVSHFLRQTGRVVTSRLEAGVWIISGKNTGLRVSSSSTFPPSVSEMKGQLGSQTITSCLPELRSYVVIIAQDAMGDGNPELGKLLMQAALNTMPSLATKPTSLIFYNGGVKLTCQGSAVLDSLKAMEEQGVDVLVCGTCLNFFELTDSLQVGRISNMLEILERTAAASSVFRP